jgi:Uri superfamily endonuclease
LGLTLYAQQTYCIGALGSYQLFPGLYIYVGSAWGPGGLAARVKRHLLGSAHMRWHIDYLRQFTNPTAIWLAPGWHLECVWAQALSHLPHASIPILGFGASDCRCATHLFYLHSIKADRMILTNNPIFFQV